MHRDNRFMHMAHVGFMSVVVNVWWTVVMFVVYRPLLNIMGF